MESPFVFGKPVSGKNFTGRNEERKQLVQNFDSLKNTILISPRGWGKSSLVEKAASEAKAANKKLHFCFLDVSAVRTQEQFYQHWALEILKCISAKRDVLAENVKKFLGAIHPKLNFGSGTRKEMSLQLDWEEVKKQPNDLLNLPEMLAEEKDWKLIICIYEFQNILNVEDSLSFQKKLKSQWRKHQQVAYCLVGSKRQSMADLFEKPSGPFLRFGEVMALEKMNREEWISFIGNRFKPTGRYISPANAKLIADLAECHPHYVQQLSQQCWLQTMHTCGEEIVRKANEGLVGQFSLLFQSQTDRLTSSQINFLKALLDGVEQLSAQETLREYQIGTSANVQRVKRALESKEIIDIRGSSISMLNPLYKSWLKTNYFKR